MENKSRSQELTKISMRAPLVKPLSQTVIRVENIYSQLITNDRETFESLRNSFR
jgi:hypothetical protein